MRDTHGSKELNIKALKIIFLEMFILLKLLLYTQRQFYILQLTTHLTPQNLVEQECQCCSIVANTVLQSIIIYL